MFLISARTVVSVLSATSASSCCSFLLFVLLYNKKNHSNKKWQKQQKKTQQKQCKHFGRSESGKGVFFTQQQEHGGPNAGGAKPRKNKAKRCGAPKGGGVGGEEERLPVEIRWNTGKFCLN